MTPDDAVKKLHRHSPTIAPRGQHRDAPHAPNPSCAWWLLIHADDSCGDYESCEVKLHTRAGKER